MVPHIPDALTPVNRIQKAFKGITCFLRRFSKVSTQKGGNGNMSGILIIITS